MAEGRMLKKAISMSRRLADLKTDSARMLYTWIIPHLDVEGRFYANPEMIKGSVVPRVKDFDEAKIQDCLTDMANVGLIILYKIDGDLYLQLRKFKDHQKLRPKREAKSIIPSPLLPDKPRTMPAQVPDNSGSMTAQDKIREVKIREENKGPADAPFILPSKEEIQECSDPKIEEYILQVCTRLYEEKIFPEVHAFKNKAIKAKKNGRGVLHVLTRCYIARPEDPWGYCQKIIAVEDGNYNERDYRKTA
jgi:hypothetical protein